MQEEISPLLSDPSLYNNRELNLLEYNQRVLEEAQDASNPLLERVKFLCFVASNLDEFFEVRVAGLKQQRQSTFSSPGPDGMSPREQLAAISSRVRRIVDDKYRTWIEELVPALEKNNIFFLGYDELTSEEKQYYTRYFEQSVFPVLTPLAVDPLHPFPQLLNKSLNVEQPAKAKRPEAPRPPVRVIAPSVVRPPQGGGQDLERRLNRLEEKMDRLLEAMESSRKSKQ